METRLCSRLKGAGLATHLFLFCFLTVEWFLRRENNRWLEWNTDYKYHSKHTHAKQITDSPCGFKPFTTEELVQTVAFAN